MNFTQWLSHSNYYSVLVQVLYIGNFKSNEIRY